jgi:hypothetical protein
LIWRKIGEGKRSSWPIRYKQLSTRHLPGQGWV